MAIRGGNYGRVGRALGDSSLELNAINMESSPDWGGLAEKSIQNRSKERQAVTAAEAVVEQTGIREKARVKGYKVLADSEKKIAKIEAPDRRMAGLVPAVGALASGAVLKRGMDLDAADALERKKENAARRQAYKEAYEKSKPTGFVPGEAPPLLEMPTLLPIPELPTSTEKSSGGGSSSTKTTPPKGTTLTIPQMKQHAINAGFTPEKARIMAAIGFGESGGRTGIDTSMTIDPQKKSEYSIGIFQINAQAHGDKLRKLGYTAEDLRDPAKNAQVAKLVHDEVGGFTPWTVFNDGKHTPYLQ